MNGTLTVKVVSRDYPYNAGTDSPKGHSSQTHSINWTSDGRTLTLTYGSMIAGTGYGGNWYVINSGTSCRVWLNGVQVASSNKSPVQNTLVKDLLADLIRRLPAQIAIPGGGQLKVSFGSDRPPAPTAENPHAFPSEAVSQSDQIVVVIPDPDYRPGARKLANSWWSLNRAGGRCERKGSDAWYEMRTKEGINDPPSIKKAGQWRNQAKIGAE